MGVNQCRTVKSGFCYKKTKTEKTEKIIFWNSYSPQCLLLIQEILLFGFASKRMLLHSIFDKIYYNNESLRRNCFEVLRLKILTAILKGFYVKKQCWKYFAKFKENTCGFNFYLKCRYRPATLLKKKFI